jgi:hypothetical protein
MLMTQQVFDAMLSFGWYLVHVGADDQAEPLFRMALDSARLQEDTVAELAALQLLGQLALRGRNFAAAQQQFADLLKVSVRSGQAFAVASALHNKGELALLRGEVSAARYCFVIAEKIYRAAGHAAGATRARQHLLALANQRQFS